MTITEFEIAILLQYYCNIIAILLQYCNNTIVMLQSVHLDKLLKREEGLISIYIYFSESANRSKSTPGLLETTGQVPLQNMNISGRHHTLPPNLDRSGVASRSSSAESGSQRSACDYTDMSRDRSNSGSHVGDHKSHYSAHDYTLEGTSGADITHSMTVSSITSYITEASSAANPANPCTVQKSQMGNDAPKVTNSARSSPKTVAKATDHAIMYEPGSNPHSPQHQYHLHQYSLHQQQHHTMLQQRPEYSVSGSQANGGQPTITDPYVRPPLIMQSVSPGPYANDHSNQQDYRAVPNSSHPTPSTSPYPPSGAPGPPPVYPHHVIPFNNYQTSQSTPAIGSMTSFPYGLSADNARVALGSHLMASNSAGSIARSDQSNEILIQEIARLRERLVVLESENATMSEKLSQQQCDVETRLAEIEMHFCGEDSPESEHPPAIINKESVI